MKKSIFRENCSVMLFDHVIGFEVFPPLTVSHFFNFVYFLFYVLPSHGIHLSLLTTSFYCKP